MQRPGPSLNPPIAVEDFERRLAAIFSADVAGYSRLTSVDEEGTMQRLAALRVELIDPVLHAHRGRLIKTMGDGVLVEFASVIDAVRAALKIQRGMVRANAGRGPNERIEFRIGIHVGDVLAQSDGDILGDNVNVAARVQSVAEPGGIFLSEDAYRQVRDRLKVTFKDLGEKELKNIPRPVRVFAVQFGPSARTRRAVTSPAPKRDLPPEKGKLRFPAPIGVRAPGVRRKIETVDEAVALVERHLPQDPMSHARWTFARALLFEAIKTGKSRDIRTAARQLTQALRNERWLEED